MALQTVAERMLKLGHSSAEIAKITGLKKVEIEKIVKSLTQKKVA
jgi:hypothetical protein